MGCCHLVVSTILIAILSVICYRSYHFFQTDPVNITVDWLGSGHPPKQRDETIREFKIGASKEMIDDLFLRLNWTRAFTPALEGTQNEYGLNPKILANFIDYLRTKYDFQERIKFLNQFPQYKTNVNGLDIHYIHVKPKAKKNIKVLPLLLVHGWPSSVREYYEMIPFLTTQQEGRDFVFEVVIPSVPGFGYSSGAAKAGANANYLGVVLKNLMLRLGHQKFFLHGSDWGSVVVTAVATIHPEHVLGFHSSFCVSLTRMTYLKYLLINIYPSWFMESNYVEKVYPLHKTMLQYLRETGYLHIQATKPDTIGYSLDNSPEGLLAFQLEKLSVGTNFAYAHKENAGLLDRFTYEALLDTIIFYYWFPKSASTAARMYAENFNLDTFFGDVANTPVDERVPCGCAHFFYDFLYQPETILREKFPNLIHYKHYDDLGHFAGLENPEMLAKDIVLFVTAVLKK